MKKLFVVLMCALIMPAIVIADVVVTREPPTSPVNKTDAVWNAPVATHAATDGAGGDFAGRIKAGGSVERLGGELSYNVITDSNIEYSYTGSSGRSSYLSVMGYRRDALELDDQRYEIAGGLSGQKFGLDISAGYDTSNKTVTDISYYDENIVISTDISTLLIPTLPITLSAQFEANMEKEDSADITNAASFDIGLEAAGVLGNADMMLSGYTQFAGDSVPKMEESASGVELDLTFPIADLFSLAFGANASTTRSRYYGTADENINQTLIVGESVGGIFTPDIGDGNELTVSLSAGREDSWPSQEGPLQDPALEEHISQWDGKAAVALSTGTGFFADPAYGFGWSSSDVLSHDISTSIGWLSPEESLFHEIRANAQITLSTDLSGSILADQKNWGTAMSLIPIEGMSIDAGYDGSERKDGSDLDWSHTASFELGHDLYGLLLYGAAATVDMQLTGNTMNTLAQEYIAHISASPPLGPIIVTTGLKETFSLANTDGSNEQHSQLEGTFDIPITSFFTAGYGLQWEWAALDGGDNDGHAFRHESRLTLSGDEIPLSLTVRYALTHGYRGMRHDAESLISVPIGEAFSLENRFNIVYDADEPEESIPFLVELSLGYAF